MNHAVATRPGDAPATTDNDPGIKLVSASGLLSILVALAIVLIGIREFLDPSAGALGFGVPLLDQRDSGLLAVKAARDVASGVVVLALLALRSRKALAYAIGALTLIPVFDGLIVFRHAAWTFTPVILIHWGTAAFMLVIVALLKSGR